jgi:hypothetical protein
LYSTFATLRESITGIPQFHDTSYTYPMGNMAADASFYGNVGLDEESIHIEDLPNSQQDPNENNQYGPPGGDPNDPDDDDNNGPPGGGPPGRGPPGEDPEEILIHGDLDSLEDLMEPLEELHPEDHREGDHPTEEEAVGHKTLNNLVNYKIRLMTDSNSTRNSKYLMSLLGMATPTISLIG